MKSISNLALATLLVLVPASFTLANAQASGNLAQTETSSAMSEGQVKKINQDTGKITIKHGELKNLGMPPMTMVFRVSDPAMLGQVNVGDSIRFIVEKTNGQLAVTRIEVEK